MLDVPLTTARVHGRVRTRERGPGLGGWRGLLGGGLALVVLAAGTLVVHAVPRSAVSWAGGPPDALERLAATAAGLEQATAPGGPGYRFTVLQTATLHQRTSGDPIPVADPADPHKVVGTASEAYVTSMISAGVVAPDGFWMEMRLGPTPGKPPDFAASPVVFTVIEGPDGTARNDGQGFYDTDQSPGMGMDPVTAKAFPRLLAGQTKLADLGAAEVDGATLHGFAGTAAREDFPGVVAADGLAFTEATFPIEVWFDADGRLVRVVARARNLNQDVWDLVLETVVSLDFTPAGTRPASQPAFDPAAKPAAPAPVMTSEVAP